MLSQFDIMSILRKQLTEITRKNKLITEVSAFSSIHSSIYTLTDITQQSLADHRISPAKKCLLLAEAVYLEGDTMVKMLIENVFIFRLSLHKRKEGVMKDIPENILPPVLRLIYRKQLMATGC